MIFRIVTILLTLISILPFLSFASEEVKSEDKTLASKIMPFKLGFEFQEAGHLCEWAKDNNLIQKKPIFSVSHNNNKLWDLVIDGSDFEFVLTPFSYQQSDLLNKALKSVQDSCKSLHDLLFTKCTYNIDDIKLALTYITVSPTTQQPYMYRNALEASYGQVGLDAWKEWINNQQIAEFLVNENLLKTNIEAIITLAVRSSEAAIKTDLLLGKKSSRIKFQKPQIQNSNVTFQNWFNTIQNLSQEMTVEKYDLIWEKVKNGYINKPREKLSFQPQATIQYPLEYTIPLWYSLFSGNFMESPIITKFKQSLPIVIVDNKVSDNDILESYVKKDMGILFLHVLTMHSICSSTINEHDLLLETKERFLEYGQVDAKGSLPLMSRIPYSLMWKGTHNGEGNNHILQNYYVKYIFGKKQNFKPKLELLESSPFENFRYVNYGQEYFDDTTGNRLDLMHQENGELHNLLDQKFYLENKDLLDFLLEKGILTTIMIKNFDPTKVKIKDSNDQPIEIKTPQEIFASFFKEMLSSVNHPTYRYYLHLKKHEIVQQPFSYDALSPPWFLDLSDAMGFYKDKFDSRYGDVIIEARMIKNVGRIFLEKMINDTQNTNTASKESIIENKHKEFLTKPTEILTDGEGLFKFLKEFRDFICTQEGKSTILNTIDSSIN